MRDTYKSVDCAFGRLKHRSVIEALEMTERIARAFLMPQSVIKYQIMHIRKLPVDSHNRTELVKYICDTTGESDGKALELIRSDIDLEQADSMGFTYLHFAAQFENPAIVKALLENGANANAETLLGASSLQLAVARCKNYAVERSCEVIKLLLEADADPDKKSRDGDSVRDLSKHFGIPEIEELVCTWGK